ncbi:MAG: cyclic nucleotide-binding domain-containing protein [Candidatus Anammoxibacter sp.]
METKKFKSGDIIIEEGSRGTCAYIIETGSVEVSRTYDKVKKILTTLGEKQVFGEMGLIEDKPRSATVTAVGNTILSEISRESFNDLFCKNPKVILSILNALFEKLRTATINIVKDHAKKKQGGFFAHDEKASVLLKDNRYIVLSGSNEISRQALDDKDLVVRTFPFKVGRRGGYDDVLTANDLQIEEREEPFYISKNHFSIDKIEGHFVVMDRGSNAGLIVNGEKVKDMYIFQMEENAITIGSAFSPFEFKMVIAGKVEVVSADTIPAASKEDDEKGISVDYEQITPGV